MAVRRSMLRICPARQPVTCERVRNELTRMSLAHPQSRCCLRERSQARVQIARHDGAGLTGDVHSGGQARSEATTAAASGVQMENYHRLPFFNQPQEKA